MSESFTHEDLMMVFAVECEENLALLEHLLVGLESSDGGDEAIDTIFRSAHTLKGNAASVGLQSVTGIAHVMEDVLDRLRERKLIVSHELVSLLLRGTDALRRTIPRGLAGDDTLDEAAQELVAVIAAFGTSDRAASGTVNEADRADRPLLQKPISAAPTDSLRPATRRLRVDLQRLDRLLDLIGEKAVITGRLRLLAERLAAGAAREEFLETIADSERLVSALQDQVTALRMVPAGVGFERQRRTVRDVAEETGKEVRLVIEGGSVEVDAAVIEQIRDPLTHMIRNSIDHGLETTEARLQAGKPPWGTITLGAAQEGDTIVIRISDDGAGLDRGRILARARERGIVAAGETPSDAEIDELIFRPGFSTAETVSDLSGRGVGMDVVNRNVAQLRGTIEIESAAGQGTTFAIRLPLTLAVIDGLAVEAGGERFVLPMQAVEECVDLPAALRNDEIYPTMTWRGLPLPLVRLSRFYELSVTPGPRENVVVVRSGNERLGVITDRLFGEMKAVIKPMSILFRDLVGVGGSTLFGDGRVGLIVDDAGLIREIARSRATSQRGRDMVSEPQSEDGTSPGA